MLGGLSRAEEDDRNVIIVARAKFRIFLPILIFSEARAEFFQQRRNFFFRFLAQMAARARVDGHISRTGKLQAAVFGAQKAVTRAGSARNQPRSTSRETIATTIAGSPNSGESGRAGQGNRTHRGFFVPVIPYAESFVSQFRCAAKASQTGSVSSVPLCVKAFDFPTPEKLFNTEHTEKTRRRARLYCAGARGTSEGEVL